MCFCHFILVVLGHIANFLYTAIVEVRLNDLLLKFLLLLHPLLCLVLSFLILDLLGSGSLAVNSVNFYRFQDALQVHGVNLPFP